MLPRKGTEGSEPIQSVMCLDNDTWGMREQKMLMGKGKGEQCYVWYVRYVCVAVK